MSNSKVLVIDLDGTSIHTDTFSEMLVAALKQKPWVLFQALWWLLTRGKPYAKQQLAETIELDLVTLPYNQDFLREAYGLSQKGYHVVMATGTHKSLANRIASYLGFIREVVATEGPINMTGQNKANQLIQRFGSQGFIYAGDSRIDRKVWSHASDVWVVNPKWRVEKLGMETAIPPKSFRLFPRLVPRLHALLNILEPELWLYNFIMFFPIFFMGSHLKISMLFTFISLCCISSGSGILRDLLNIETYRRESDLNAFARGYLNLFTGIFGAPILLISGLIFALYTVPGIVMLLALWAIILVRNDGIISGLSRLAVPLLAGILLG